MLKPLIGITVILSVSAAIALAGSQGSVMIGPYPLFALCATVGFLLHWTVFIPSFMFQTEHYFDLTGGLSYLSTVGLAYAVHPGMDSRGMILCLMVAVWSARLGTFLFLRVKRAGQDRRFTEIKRNFSAMPLLGLLVALVFITMAAALAAITSARQLPVDGLAYLGALIWAVGLAWKSWLITRKQCSGATQPMRENLSPPACGPDPGTLTTLARFCCGWALHWSPCRPSVAGSSSP